MSSINPTMGEIWWVEFSPQVGKEIAKVRPAVVVSDPSVGALPLRIVVPITDPSSIHPWHVELTPDSDNKLKKRCVADTFQVKSASLDRFKSKLGEVTPEDLEKITEAIVYCLGR